MHLRNRQFNWHGDILLGDFRCCAGAAIGTIEMDDVRTGVERTDCDHVDIVRGTHLDRKQSGRIDGLDPIEMLRMVLDRVSRMEWEWAE